MTDPARWTDALAAIDRARALYASGNVRAVLDRLRQRYDAGDRTPGLLSAMEDFA